MTRKREKAEGRGDVTPFGETAEKSSNELASFVPLKLMRRNLQMRRMQMHTQPAQKSEETHAVRLATKSREVPLSTSQRLRAAAVASSVSMFITDFCIQNHVSVLRRPWKFEFEIVGDSYMTLLLPCENASRRRVYKRAVMACMHKLRMALDTFCVAIAGALERLCALKPDSLLPFVAVTLDSDRACASDNQRVKLVQVAPIFFAFCFRKLTSNKSASEYCQLHFLL